MNWFKKHLYFLPVLLYLPALGNFFSGDDWFHLRISQIDSFQQFLNFFSFSANAQTASFYRPLSTQVFFFVFQKLFGFTAWPYYLFGLLLFAYTLHLVYKFSVEQITKNPELITLVYGISVSNFTRLYFLSALQELFLVIFSLLTLINFKKKPFLSLFFFVLALFSKETAIVLPVLLFTLNIKNIKNIFTAIYDIRYTIYISAIYLYFRFLHFGLAAGDSYLWNFSPIKAVNTLMWYVLWSFGAPELLVDYVGSGLRLIPRFFTDYQYWWPVIIFPLLGIITLFAYSFIRHCEESKTTRQSILRYSLFFLIALLPVLFLPSHKFTLELGLPLVAFSIILASLFSISKSLYHIPFTIYLIYNLSMNFLTYTRHYSVSRGEISKRAYQYFTANYPQYPVGKKFFFINDAKDNGQIWGQSKQVSQAVSGSDMFRALYKNNNLELYYQDLNSINADQDTIIISTAQFLKP